MKKWAGVLIVILAIFFIAFSAIEAMARRVIVVDPIISLAESSLSGAESWGNRVRDQLLYGLRGQWADYLKMQWQYKDLVVDAYFTNPQSVYVQLKAEAKPRKDEFERLIKKSYQEWVVPKAEESHTTPYELIPGEIIVVLSFKG